MTLGFAESIPEGDNVVYHVEWLDSQQAFPSLSSSGDHTQHHHEDWQFLHRQEIIQAQEDMNYQDGHRLNTSEKEDKWQQVDFLREKQFLDIVVEATDLPEAKIPPTKPQRQQKQAPSATLTEEQQRLIYWNMIDALDEEAADFYDLYEDRKSKSARGAGARQRHIRRHMAVVARLHHRFELGELWDNSKIQQYLDHMATVTDMDKVGINSTLGHKHWGPPPAMDPRLRHALVHVALPRSLDRSSVSTTPRSKILKSSMEPDFCVEAKN